MAALAFTGPAHAAVGYIATAGGLLLHANGDEAVLTAWTGQSPIQGFSGYGRIHLEGRCLTGRTEGAPLRWEGCRLGDKGQVWKFIGDRLSNELEHCAEVEDGPAAKVRVLAQVCTGQRSQRWKPLATESAEDVAVRIADPLLRTVFLRSIAAAKAGVVVSLASGQVVRSAPAACGMVVHLGGGTVVRLDGHS